MAKEITDTDREESHRQRLPTDDAAQLADPVPGLVCRLPGLAVRIADAAGNAAQSALDRVGGSGFVEAAWNRIVHAGAPFWSINASMVPEGPGFPQIGRAS